MARLLTWPDGLWGFTDVSPANGPNARNSGSNTASDGSEQTFTGIGDVVALDLALSPKNGRVGARHERGLVLGLRSGANAIRLQFNDPDIMTPKEAGVVGPFEPQSWSNGEPWSNGQDWKPSYPVVPVAAAVGLDKSIVRLGDAFWGHTLGVGDYIGFFPFHFGLYCVTEVRGGGEYQVWPRLRKALTTDDFATLHPTLAMKLAGPTPAPGRNLTATSGSLRLVEVFDYYIRDGAFDG